MKLPAFLPQVGWSRNHKGYLIYTSRKRNEKIRRGARAHRLVAEYLLGRRLLAEEHVHHMDFDKCDNLPGNLLICPQEFNPSPVRQCPYTGQFLSFSQYQRRFGAL